MLVAVGRLLAKDTCKERERGRPTVDREPNKYRDVRTMEFRRDIIFNDRILLALCVGTAILGLVALAFFE